MQSKKVKFDEQEIRNNIKWFKKFSLKKRLEIADMDTKITLKLKNLKIEDYEKSKRTS